MDRFTTLPNSQVINKEACEWIAKLDGDEPSAQDRADLKKWLNQSPQHKAELQRLAKLWGQLNVLTELAVPNEKCQSNRLSKSKPVESGGYRKARVTVFAAAALLMLAVGLVLQTGLLDGSHQPSTTVYATVVGEQQLVTLRDGSTILLNTDSRAAVDYNAERRQIRLLKGEAHFDVMPDIERPFVVYAGKGAVRAVGTAFSIYVTQQGMEVTVTEGSVELNAAAVVNEVAVPGRTDSDDPAPTVAIVKAGQRASVAQTIEAIETMAQEQLARKLSWREGLFRFSGDRLEDVIKEMSRYTAQSIVILDPEIRDLRIGGIFKVGETEKMFAALESGFGIRVERIGNNLVQLSASAP